MRRGLFDRLETGARSIDEAESIVAHLGALLNERAIVDLTDLVHSLPSGMRTVPPLASALKMRSASAASLTFSVTEKPCIFSWRSGGQSEPISATPSTMRRA